MDRPSIAVVTPVLNDWNSFEELARRIGTSVAPEHASIHIVAVDDGSLEIKPPANDALVGAVDHIEIVCLNANQGHQRAIALGLAHAYNANKFDAVIVMDSDGEDKPEAIAGLLKRNLEHPNSIIVAQRTRRSEGVVFKAFYQLYKWVFRFLTGQPISFGNFSLIPKRHLPNVLFNAGVWNNFAATLLRSRINIVYQPTERGERILGQSKMGFTGLLIHGFSAISIFTDVVIGRIMMILGIVSLATFAIIAWVLWTKFFTSTFVPGYATTIILAAVSFLGLTLFMGFLFVLSLLSARSQPAVLPTQVVEAYVRSVMQITRSKASTPTT